MRILIVEDQMITARDLAEILAECGHEVTGHARDYEGALHQMKIDTPDLALVDISLAGTKDGVEFARILREEYSTIIVFVTALTDDETLSRVMAVRPNGFVVKPFSKESIYAAIELAGLDHIADGMKTLSQTTPRHAMSSQNGLPPKIMKVIVEYIERRFNRELPVSELADLVQLSEDYFSVQFRKATGVSPHQYIMAKRLEEARHLLRHTDLPVNEVAEMSGYANQAYFSAIFKKNFGVTPTRYKQS